MGLSNTIFSRSTSSSNLYFLQFLESYIVNSILQFKYILKQHNTETIQKHMYMHKAINK